MQGFSVLEVVNPAEDDIRLGPREAIVFRNQDKDKPFGVEFKSPNAPLRELRADIESQLQRVLDMNGVPAAALGAAINQRQLSGEAIRAAMQPITDDLEERAAIFEPAEWEIADSVLRTIAHHEPTFLYDPVSDRPEFKVTYQPLSLPHSVREQVTKDDFDITQGITTPAAIMRRDNPEEFATHEDAVKQWEANLAETKNAGFSTTETEPEGLQASYGPEKVNRNSETPLFDFFSQEDDPKPEGDERAA